MDGPDVHEAEVVTNSTLATRVTDYAGDRREGDNALYKEVPLLVHFKKNPLGLLASGATGRQRPGRGILRAGSMALALMMVPSIGSAQYASPVDYGSGYETTMVAAETPEPAAEAAEAGVEGGKVESEVEKLFTADEVREIVRDELKAKAEEEEKKKKEADAAPYVVGSDLKMSASWKRKKKKRRKKIKKKRKKNKTKRRRRKSKKRRRRKSKKRRRKET